MTATASRLRAVPAPDPTLAPGAADDAETGLAFLAGRILANAGWLVAAQVVAGVTQFLRSALLARHLGPEAYGHWGFALAFVSFFLSAADLGLSTIGVRDLARGERAAGYYGTAAILKLAISLVFVGFLAAVEPLVNHDPQTRLLIYLLGAGMLTSSLTLVLQAVVRAHERMGIEALVTSIQSVVLLAAIAALVALEASVIVLAGAYLAVSCAALLAMGLIVAFRFLPRGLHFDAEIARRLLRDLWPVAAAMMTTAVYYYFDRVMMGALGQQTQIGWYTAAYAPALWVTGMVAMIRAAFLPAQSRAVAGPGPRPLLRYYGKVSLGLGLPIAVGGALVAKPLMVAMYGQAYGPGAFAMLVLNVTAGVMFASSFYGSNLLVRDRQRIYLVGVFLGAIVNVALNVVLLPRFSLNGAAVATLAAECTVLVFMAADSRALLPLRDAWGMARGPLLASAVMAAVLLLIAGWVPLGVSVGAAAAVYMAAAWRFRIASGEVTA